MKKIIYSLGIIAASAFAFSACQKEQAANDKISTGKLVTVSFIAEKAGTKTAAVEGETEVSFVWTDEDIANMKLFTVGTEEKVVNGETTVVEVLTPVANPTVTKVSDTELTITAEVEANATYIFRAVMSGTWTNDGTKPRLSDSQSPTVSNFDPSADILISEDETVEVGEEASSGTLKMVFHRPIVANKMTLKNLSGGEKIQKIVISSAKELAGYVNTNTRTPSGDKKVITLNYNGSVTAPANGQVPVYFNTIPGKGHSLTIEVTTDQNIYSKSFAEGKSIDFNLGEFTTFNFALPAGVANTALSLPVEDAMSWAVNGIDATSEITANDYASATQGEKKIYDSATKAYKGVDGLKMGTSRANGSITTNDINLSSAFYIAIDAKAYGNDKSQLIIQVDGNSVFTSEDLTSVYETYYVNCSAATSKSKVTIQTVGRGYIRNLEIGPGTYTVTPKAITFSQPAEGGSFTVSVDGSIITSGTTVEAGKTVTLTATAADNFAFSKWTVTGATVSDNTAASATFKMGNSNVNVTASFTSTIANEHIATILFGNQGTNINKASVTGTDSENNTWTITTVGTDSFTQSTSYSQVGSSKKPATSITFTTTLSKDATNISLEAKFGGFGDTAGDVTLNVGENTIGTGSLNGTNDVTVKSTSTDAGKVLTVTVTNIAKGVKCYSIKATYTN